MAQNFENDYWRRFVEADSYCLAQLDDGSNVDNFNMLGRELTSSYSQETETTRNTPLNAEEQFTATTNTCLNQFTPTSLDPNPWWQYDPHEVAVDASHCETEMSNRQESTSTGATGVKNWQTDWNIQQPMNQNMHVKNSMELSRDDYSLLESSNETKMDADFENDRFLSCLGLHPLEEIQPTMSLDIAGIFPDLLLETIRQDSELYVVYRTFFDSKSNEDHELEVENPTLIHNLVDKSNKSSSGRRQKPLAEKKLPVKRLRRNDEVSLPKDGGNSGNSRQ